MQGVSAVSVSEYVKRVALRHNDGASHPDFNELSVLFSSGQVTCIKVCPEQGAESDVYFINLRDQHLGDQHFCLKIFKGNQNDDGVVINSNGVDAAINEVSTGKVLQLLGVDTAYATFLSLAQKEKFIQALYDSNLPQSLEIVGFLNQRPALWMDRVYGRGAECLVSQEGLSQGQLDETKVRNVVRAYLATRLLATGDGIGEEYREGGDLHLMQFFNPNSGNVLVDLDSIIVLLDQKFGVGGGNSFNLSHDDDVSYEIKKSLMNWWKAIIHELGQSTIQGSNGDLKLSDTLESAVFSILNYHEDVFISKRDQHYGNYKFQVIQLMKNVLSEFKQIKFEEFQRYLKESGISMKLQRHILDIYDLINSRNFDCRTIFSCVKRFFCCVQDRNDRGI